ncbi:MAG: RnfABCDGE type electron transport complex subunit D [Erysipelothrix sp.]|nr:RnfABCDGE type electron transport complex subunit D [Erysipelothrix sp.]
MKYITRIRPNFRDRISTMRIMLDLTLGLLILTIVAAVFYSQTVSLSVGLRVVYVVATAVITNIVLELLFGMARKKTIKQVFKQQFPWVTGLILALAVPVTTNLYVVAMTTAISVIFGKIVYGGFGQNVFNPAGIGRAIVFSSFARPVVESITKTSDIFTSATPANLMNSFGWLPTVEAFNSKAFAHIDLKGLLFGNHFGTIGETFAIVIILVAMYLIARRVIDWRIPVVYVGTLFIAAWIIGAVNGLGIWYPLTFVLSGGVLFGAVFMLTDPVTCPTQVTGRVVFAMGAAVITLLIRFLANAPEGVVFSILIMNMLTPLIEDFLNGQQTRMKKRYVSIVVSMVVVVGLSIVWVTQSVDAVAPTLDLGEQVTSDIEDVDRYGLTSIESKADGANTLYTVAVEGYGLRDSEYQNPKYQENIIEVVVDSNNIIVSAKMTQFGDTEGIGDLVNDDLYFETFVGKDLSKADEMYDTVSTATKTSYSFIRALRAISDEIGGDK